MTARDHLSRWLSPSLFGLTVLCFLLPFATVSCDSAKTTFTGMQLVTRSVPAGGMVSEGKDCSADLSRCVQDRGSLPAAVALVAAFVGLVLGLAGIVTGSGSCAVAGIIALLWLVEPALEPFGPDVRLHAGYDLALLLFICAAGVRIRAARDGRRRGERRPRGAVRVHVAALSRYLLLALLIAIVAAGSDATIQSIGDYTLTWILFAVVPAWIALTVIVACRRKYGRAELARCDSLLWLGPFLVLGLCSRKIRRAGLVGD